MRRWAHASDFRRIALLAATIVLALSVVQAGGREAEERTSAWTVREAESISTVRGEPVHVTQCRGLGRSRQGLAVDRYRSFACVAGTGLEWESFDSVAVSYVLVPLGAYEGGCSDFVMRDVRFTGGAGIP